MGRNRAIWDVMGKWRYGHAWEKIRYERIFRNIGGIGDGGVDGMYQ